MSGPALLPGPAALLLVLVGGLLLAWLTDCAARWLDRQPRPDPNGEEVPVRWH